MLKYSTATFFVLITSFLLGQQITFKDCDEPVAIPDLLIFSEEGKFLGFTNSQGTIDINSDISNIKVVGLNINDTTISTVNKKEICINRIAYNLNEFKVEETKSSSKDIYIDFLEKSWDNMVKTDTIFYYNFQYTIQVPDSNWKETIKGVLKIHAVPTNKVKTFPLFPKIYYAKINYSVDDRFIQSSIYKYSSTILYEYMNIPLDLMYLRKEFIRKEVEKKTDNIFFIENDSDIIFIMDKSGKKLNIKQKTLFRNNLIIENEIYTIEGNVKKGLNNYYKKSVYTDNSQLLDELLMKKIVKKNGIFFVVDFKISLMDKPYKGKSINQPISIIMNYQKWLKSQK